MGKYKNIFKFILWFIFFVTFAAEFLKIVFELTPNIGHKSLGMANAFFWSCLFLIEIIMAGLVINYMIKNPARRLRLLVLSVFHFSVILILPMVFDNWSWTCLLYPWPHSMQAFDPQTPRFAFILSVTVGFIVVPLVTYRWGFKGFCGYMCPHGAFFSETYGRVFAAHPRRYRVLPRFIPRVYLVLMVMALAAVIVGPFTIGPIRSVQSLAYFFTAEFLYFVVGVPLWGGRRYCRFICPMGNFVMLMVRLKRRWHKKP